MTPIEKLAREALKKIRGWAEINDDGTNRNYLSIDLISSANDLEKCVLDLSEQNARMREALTRITGEWAGVITDSIARDCLATLKESHDKA